MLFNSYEFIFFFLPLSLAVYFLLNRYEWFTASRTWLVLASLFFYGWWKIEFMPVMLGSILFNFSVGACISRLVDSNRARARAAMIFGVTVNLLLLGYFKYYNFFLTNLNALTGAHLPPEQILLPLGISFFTFTQTAYLVDAYRSEVKSINLLNYSLFVTYFPHLIAGPILHHKEMMPQFADRENKRFNADNLAKGIFLFVIGLAKKVIIADTFAVWATLGFDNADTLRLLEAWVTSFCYTIQLYFDFSGYTDMALGAALMFNIRLPQNFNSPYKAQNLQDFWRRWHMTLSRFLRDYLYIPLGGNRRGEARTCLNLIVTFLLGGLWHGAGWTFIAWGALHGVGLVIHRQWSRLNVAMPAWLAWLITFNFVNVAWVFFRAKTWDDAMKVLSGMVGLNGVVLPKFLKPLVQGLQGAGVEFGSYLARLHTHETALLALLGAILIVSLSKNSNQLTEAFVPRKRYAVALSLLAVYLLLNLTHVSEFLYFDF